MPARLDKKKLTPLVHPTPPLPKPKPKPRPQQRDELSTGAGSSLRRRARAITGESLKVPQLETKGPRFSVGQLLANASTLRTEVRGDGRANCLERAVQLARPGDRVVLLADRNDPVGHAVVHRPDGSVVDPNAPLRSFRSLDAFTAANPRYGSPVSISDATAERLLATPPGAQRDALIKKLGLDRIADRRVADPAPAGGADSDVEQAAAQVAEAYREGGAQAAAELLNSATIAFEPEVVARITEAARPTIDRIVDDLRAQSRDADGDQAEGGDQRRAFDVTLANLSAAVGRGGGEMLEHVTGRIAAIIQADGIGRFDEALGNAVIGGPNYLGFHDDHLLTDGSAMNTTADARLALGVIEQLRDGGKTDEADDILQNVDASMRALNGAAERLSEAVNGFNGELAQLVNDWSGLMTQPQLDAAIEAFKESHPEYEALERLAGGALRVQDQLADAPAQLDGLGHADDLADSIERATDTFPELAGLTESGQAELANMLERSDGDSGLLGQIASLAAQRKKDAGYLQKVGNLLLNSTVATALSASEAGDLAAVGASVRNLERQAAVFGIAPDRMSDITRNLEAAATAPTQQAAEDALQRMDLSIERAGQEGVFATTSGLGQAFRAAGVTLGAAATVGAVAAAIDDPTFSNVVGALSGAAGTADGAISLAQGVTRNFQLLKGAAGVLRNVGTLAGVVGTGMSVFSAAQALERGDAAQASLFALQAAGGIAVLAGATGVGTVIAVGAGLALAQLERVRASNRFENEHTEAFLQAAGLSSDATNHLRNADDDGRSVGPVLAALARRMNVEPSALLQSVGELEPGRLLQLVEAMHGVDPNGEGVFPQTDDSDAQAGLPVRPGAAQLRGPRSVEGIVRFIENTGIELGDLPRPVVGPVLDRI